MRKFKTFILLVLLGAGLVWGGTNQGQAKLAQWGQLATSLIHQGKAWYENQTGNSQATQSSAQVADEVTANNSVKLTWPKRRVTVYIARKNSASERAIWKQAIKKWNRTGAFTFEIVSSKKRAKVILTVEDQANTVEAGATTKTWLTNQQTGKSSLVKAVAKLNRYYMRGYSRLRQLNTAEHELGHVIGLNHVTRYKSVMNPQGSFYGIQARDVAAVNKLYRKG